MKEIRTERKVFDIHYEAIDGTEFIFKEECEKYDKSAKAVLRSKFRQLVVKAGNEYTFFDVGNDESVVYAIKMVSEADVTTVKQLWELDHEWMQTSTNYADRQKESYAPIDKAYKEKDILFIGEDCEGQTYIIGTRADIIERLQNLDKEEYES